MRFLKTMAPSLLTQAFCLAITLGCGIIIGNPPSVTEERTVTGSAGVGNLSNAQVTLYRLNEDGSQGTLVGATQTDAKGNFSITVKYFGPVAFVVTGGQYQDPASGETVQPGSTAILRAAVGGIRADDAVNIHALTTLAASKALQSPGTDLITAIRKAQTDVAELFAISDVDIIAVRPGDLTQPGSLDATASETRLGLILTAFSQMLKDEGQKPTQLPLLINALAEDYKDGKLDNLVQGAPIPGTSPVNPKTVLEKLDPAKRNFLDSPQNKSGVKNPDSGTSGQTQTQNPPEAPEPGGSGGPGNGPGGDGGNGSLQ
ncbi:hypothetical protein [Oligoflexus tunisiensis]|uniref:hypothetical protein n=1 Tax=Oligoflexus tunisiensis TaxID=708132 RepID=UPI00114CFD46|nr:hypothetical protein [Oligoflexus tunisiensis]